MSETKYFSAPDIEGLRSEVIGAARVVLAVNRENLIHALEELQDSIRRLDVARGFPPGFHIREEGE